jgi:hypothetical protein
MFGKEGNLYIKIKVSLYFHDIDGIREPVSGSLLYGNNISVFPTHFFIKDVPKLFISSAWFSLGKSYAKNGSN